MYIAVVCGVLPYGDEEIAEFIGVSTVSTVNEVDEMEAMSALLNAVRTTWMSKCFFLEQYNGALIYFHTIKQGSAKKLRTIYLETARIQRIFFGIEDDRDEAGKYREHPITISDMEPFLPPDDLEDIFVEPEDWY